MNRLLICVPTVDGRDDHLKRCLASIDEQDTPGWVVHTQTFSNRRTCGAAWNEAIALAHASYDALLLMADDLELVGRSALAAGLAWLDPPVGGAGSPAALIYNAESGVVESHGLAWRPAGPMPCGMTTRMTRIPLGLASWFRPIPPIHYFSDNAVSSLFEAQGITIVCEPGFVFRHHWAQAGRQAMTGAQWNAESNLFQAYDAQVRNDPAIADVRRGREAGVIR